MRNSYLAVLGIVVVLSMAGASPMLAQQGCPAKTAYKSAKSKTAATIQFWNNSPAQLTIWWVDYNGDRKFNRTLPASKAVYIGTYVGHVFLVGTMFSCSRPFVVKPGIQSHTYTGSGF